MTDTTRPDSAAPGTPDTPPSRPRQRPPRQSAELTIRFAHRFLLTILGLVLVAAAALGLLLGTEAGWRALASAAGILTRGAVTIESPSGRLVSSFGAGKVQVRQVDGQRVLLEDAMVAWREGALFGGTLHLSKVSARTLRVTPGAKDSAPASLGAPDDLRVPLALRIDTLHVGRLRIGSEGPSQFALDDLQASFQTDGRRHQLSRLQARGLRGRFDGELALDGSAPFATQARLDWQGMVEQHPARLGLRCVGDLDGKGLDCSANLFSDAGDGSARSTLKPFQRLPLDQLDLRFANVDPAAWDPRLPRARLQLEASLTPRDSLEEVEGLLTARNLAPGPWDAGRLPLLALRAPLRWHLAQPAAPDAPQAGAPRTRRVVPPLQRTLDSDRLELTLAGGGRVRGPLSLRQPLPRTGSGAPGMPLLDTQLTLGGVNLSQLHGRLLTTSASGAVALQGPLDTLAVSATLEDPRAALRLRAQLARDAVGIDELLLRAGAGSLTLQGRAGLQQAAPTQPRAPAARTTSAPVLTLSLDGRLDRFDPSKFGRFAAGDINLDLQARGTLGLPPESGPGEAQAAPAEAGRQARLKTADANGSWRPPAGSDLELRIASRPSAWFDAPLSAQIVARATPGRLTLEQTELSFAGNTLSASGSWGMPGDQLAFDLQAPQLDRLGRILEQPLQGRLTASGTVGGAAAGLQASVGLAAESLALGIWRVASASGSVHLSGGLDGRWIGVLQARDVGRVATASNGRGARRQMLAPELSASLDGTRGAHRLAAAGRLPDKGQWQLRLDGVMNAANHWRASVDTATLAQTGVFDGQLQRTFGVSVDAGKLALDNLDWSGASGRLQIDEIRHEAGRWKARGRVERLAVVPLFEALREDSRHRTEALRGDLTLASEWNLSGAGALLDGEIQMARQAGDLILPGERPMALDLRTLRATVRARGAALDLSIDGQSGTIGNVAGQLTLPLRATANWPEADRDAPLAGQLRMQLASLAWLAPATEERVTASGRLDADVSLAGTLAAPQVNGAVRGSDLLLTLPDSGVRLDEGTLAARFDTDALVIDRLHFTSKVVAPPRSAPFARDLALTPGELLFSGRFSLRDLSGNLDYQAKRFPLMQRAEAWLLASGKGAIRVSANRALKLSGEWQADAGWLSVPESSAPTLSDDVVVAGREADDSNRMPLTLDLSVALGRSVHFSGRGLDTRLAGVLRMTAEPGSPLRTTGSVRLRDGRYTAYGQKLQLERGIINFQGPIDNPGLNVLAVRDDIAVSAGVQIDGTLLRPRVRLWSDAAMPDADKLAWVVLGRPAESSEADAGLLLQAAQSLLGGEGDGPVRQLVQTLGFDEFSIGGSSRGGGGPTSSVARGDMSAGANTLNTQVVTIGKRLTAQTTLAYEQALSGAGYIVRLTHQLNRNLSVVLRTGDEQAISLQFSRSYR